MTTTITTLPYTITTPGKYILDNSGSSTYVNSAIAINIIANDVTLDLNGCKIINSGGGPNTTNKGIHVNSNLSGTVIKNGYLRGWFYGIHFEDNTYSRDVIIENMTIVASTFRGIVATGRYNVIRHCVIENVTGCTYYPNAFCMGIEFLGQGIIEHNRIFDVYGMGVTGEGVGISSTDYGQNSVVRYNYLMNQAFIPAHSFGVWVGGGSECLVMDNIIRNYANGITASSSVNGIGHKDNFILNATTPIYAVSTDFLDFN